MAAVAGLSAFLPAIARAADPEAIGDTGSMLRALLGLAFVIVLIVVAGWVVRRISPQQGRSGSAIRVIASQGVGARERVLLLEVADQWLVVGVAPGRVQSLATLPRGELPPDPQPATPGNFGTLLARALQRDKR
ncbi:MAG TPA: flagellar biosynthetic protein FliO [Casimicrobiaceae bacterium]|nr:flagellar biosynthetic protein FliO [Casimicrobiaceae bacterium]